MTDTIHKHLGAIANYVTGKVNEYRYQLRELVEECDATYEQFRTQGSGRHGTKVVYSFSALGNAMQSLKDAVNSLGDNRLTWAEIGKNPHGDFMYKSRNAATHDGNPIVDAWVDGQFYVANDISRFDMRGKPIKIVRPVEDIRTVCLQFSEAYSAQLRSSLSNMLGKYTLKSIVDFEDAEKFVMKSEVVPPFIKDMFLSKRNEIIDSLQNAPDFDPIQKAIDSLHSLEEYCSLQELR